MAAPEPFPQSLDEAIGAYLRGEGRLELVEGFGPDALRRVVGLYYGHEQWSSPPDLSGAAREIADAWAVLLGRLAVAHPGVYLDEVEARRIRLTRHASPTSEVVIVGLVDEPRAVPLLVRCARHRDWLVRFHAIQGLARRDEPEAIKAVERAAKEDCSVSVRVVAADGVARKDPARARILYVALLQHPHLTPMLRKQVNSAISTIDRTNIVRH